MTWVDLVVLGVLAVSALFAFMRGLVREVLGLGAWVGAIFAGVWALPRVRPQFQQWLGTSPWIDPVAFAADHSRLYNFLYKKWYIDELYDNVIVSPLRRLAMYLWRVIDVKVIDGTLMGIARGVDELSEGLRTLQTGLVRNYALAIALGMVVIIGVYFAAFSDLFR